MHISLSVGVIVNTKPTKKVNRNRNHTMVGEWYESDKTLKSAVSLTGVTFVIFMVAFFSPYWLQSVPSEKLPEPKFTNLGKNTHTKRSFSINIT